MLLTVKRILFIKCIILSELYRSLLGAYVQQATWTTSDRLHDPRKRARGRLEKRNVENYALWLLLGHRCRPFYPRHVLYTRPTYRILALLIKHMLPVKCILFVSAYSLVAACYKRMRLTTSFYGILVSQFCPRQVCRVCSSSLNLWPHPQSSTGHTFYTCMVMSFMVSS